MYREYQAEKRLTHIWVEGLLLFIPLIAIAVAAVYLPEQFYPDAGDTYTLSGFLGGFAALSLVATSTLAVQYGAMRHFGARPRFAYFRFTFSSALGTAWIAERHKFSRDQFANILLWPALVSSSLLALCFLVLPVEPWWVIAAIALALMSARSLLYYFLTLRRDPDTLIEENRDGTLVYEPY